MTTRTTSPDHGRDGEDEQLACGRLVFDVWDAWEYGRSDAHLRDCPHCRESVRGLEQLQSAVRGLRDSAVDPPADDMAPLTQRIMDVVRLELQPGRPLPLGEAGEDLWITEAVAARTLRAAAEGVSGVRAGSCRFAPSLSFDTGPVEVCLDIHAPVDAHLPDIADDVRREVRAAADDQLGLVIAAVDVRITDLVVDSDESREGRSR
ncbi:Asp23/Gls24 family envelope stress response protein [Streptomyces sp. C10-9-1]|uniref:Asp23/Gls24 family envelope stress response protein n=1 Tax=Streptomyces sp. C10-9-1 TaxID=1859285 RepID=UPI003F4A3F87